MSDLYRSTDSYSFVLHFGKCFLVSFFAHIGQAVLKQDDIGAVLFQVFCRIAHAEFRSDAADIHIFRLAQRLSGLVLSVVT